MKVNADKCVFFKRKVVYLGHCLENGKLSVNPVKVEAILNARPPADVKELQSYMGLVNYFRKFVDNIAITLRPLYKLLNSEDKFKWEEEHQRAFVNSKTLVTDKSCLKIFNPNEETLVLCDASPVGVAAVLVQKDSEGIEVPVHYASRALTDTQRRYAQLHREGLAVVFALKKFYTYLYGRPFTIVTDAQSIKEMFHPDKLATPVASARIQRWGVYLSQFEYSIEHRSSRHMCVPDALSRLPMSSDEGVVDDEEADINIGAVSDHLPVTFSEILKEAACDKEWQEWYHCILHGFPNRCSGSLLQLKRLRNGLSLESGAILYNNRLVIPISLRERVLHFCHEGHKGVVLMKKFARQHVYWPGIDDDIESFVRSCSLCQETSYRPKRPVTSSWPEAQSPMERVHIDFFKFKGKTALVIVDAYSGFIEVVSMRKTDCKNVTAVLNNFMGFFGLCETLVSDNGPPFNSGQFRAFCEKRGIKCLKSPPYHPESNGLAEVAVRVVKAGLKKLCLDQSNR